MAEAHFDGTLEFLHENITFDPALAQWLDRDLDISPNGNLILSPVGMPRVITSRSLDKETGGPVIAKMTKTEVKASVVVALKRFRWGELSETALLEIMKG